MSHRRYKVGINPRYDREFDWRKGQSGILNRANNSSVSFDLWSESGVQNLLIERIGEQDGLVADPNGYWISGLLRAAREAVAAVDTRFENMVIKAKRAGRYPPETMPEELVNEKLVMEARLDICQEEIDQLKKMLAKHQTRKQAEDDHLILAQGPMGTTSGADPPRSVDGQKIRWDEIQKHFIIDCEKSPYHLLRLPDYYAHVSRPWREAKRVAHNEAYAKAHDLEASDGARKKWGEEAARILRAPDYPPWPPRPEES